MSDNNAVGVVTPPKKNPCGKIVSSSQRRMIINLYKAKLVQMPGNTLRKYRQIISKELGIGEKTISKTITEYNHNKTVTSPSKKRMRFSFPNTFDDFQRNSIRRLVHSFWFKKQIPTVDKIYTVVSNDDTIPPISRTHLFRLLKLMDFEYTKRSSNSALTEKDEIVVWRRKYLEDLKKYREEGRHVYYLDETWVDQLNKSHCDAFQRGSMTSSENSSGKGKCIIVLHIGSEDGFLPGGLLCFESKNNSIDYHDEIHPDIFYEWMESILPRLKENCIIVMDNASYHSIKVHKIPTSTTTKADIIEWLEGKGQVIDRPMVIPQLLTIVNQMKPLYDQYKIDELAKGHGHTILRLPPYHRELNPIELAWTSVKNHVKLNNTTNNLADVKVLLNEGIECVNSEMWTNFINHTKKEEEKFWKIDFIVDDMLTAETQLVTINITGETTSSSDSF